MSLIDNMKEVADLIKKVGDTELYRKIVELEGEVIELTHENHQLKKKVEDLERKLALQKQMIFKAPLYFQEGDQTPYCPACWEEHRRAVHLVLQFRGERTRWDCPSCKQTYLLEAGLHY